MALPRLELVIVDDTLGTEDSEEDHQELRVWLKAGKDSRVWGRQKRVQRARQHAHAHIGAVCTPQSNATSGAD